MKLNKEQVKKFLNEKNYNEAVVLTKDEIQSQGVRTILNDLMKVVTKKTSIIIINEK